MSIEENQESMVSVPEPNSGRNEEGVSNCVKYDHRAS